MKYVCLMRGINVSGQRKVNMKTLCTQLAELGMDNVSYYLQSGNLLFDTLLTSSEIKATITQLLGDAYDYQDVDLFLFTFDALQAIYDEMLHLILIRMKAKATSPSSMTHLIPP